MQDLNHEQRTAARPGRGCTLLVAGAGTGKTKTLVERVANTISEGLAGPAEVLVLTFSRKAAAEVRHRVAERLGGGPRIWAGTFHSLGLALVKHYGDRYCAARGYGREPVVLDETGRADLLRALIVPRLDEFLGLPVGVVIDLLDRHAAPGGPGVLPPVLAPALVSLSDEYRRAKRERCALDYEDLMRWGADLLSGDAAVRAAVQARWPFVFVDEYQDTADDTMALLRLIMPPRGGNCFAVGDDWQSIYGFRGARPDYLINWERHFPEGRRQQLTVNYRSRREIVELSSAVIARNRRRTRKRLTAARGGGGSVFIHDVRDEREEARLAADLAAAACAAGGSVAVLYRNHWQGERMRRSGGVVPGVQYGTMHGAKGLEFDTVIAAGIADGVLPDRGSDIAEERRLLYVALSRARERLHCLRYVDGEGRPGLFGGECERALPYRSRIMRTMCASSRGV